MILINFCFDLHIISLQFTLKDCTIRTTFKITKYYNSCVCGDCMWAFVLLQLINQICANIIHTYTLIILYIYELYLLRTFYWHSHYQSLPNLWGGGNICQQQYTTFTKFQVVWPDSESKIYWNFWKKPNKNCCDSCSEIFLRNAWAYSKNSQVWKSTRTKLL